MKHLRALLFCLAAFPLLNAIAVESSDPLAVGFQLPPDSAKPQTWWHWMNGNISKPGITADLEAMKQIGLGGATIVNVDCGIPRGEVPFMSPAWREDFKFAIQEAGRLGLDMTVENCAGWSSSGGPWNTPENAMQHLVASEVRVTGSTNLSITLPLPATKLNFYRDIAVLAIPDSAGEENRMKNFAPIASASAASVDAKKIADGDKGTSIQLPAPKRGEPQFVQLEFARPFSARTLVITGGSPMPECSGEILISDDGKKFRAVKSFAYGRRASATQSLSLGGQPLAARFWRVQFARLGSKEKATTIPLAEIELAPQVTIENLEMKIGMKLGAGWNQAEVLSAADASAEAEGAVQRRGCIDLTSKVSADGKLNWQVPAGRWVIQRFGYTPTGAINAPSTKEGEGLECDKFTKAALDAHWDGFMKKVLKDVGPLAGKTLTTSLIDSYEVGGQNWSRDFRAEFQKRRGYDPVKFLPAFTGRIVESPAVTERFLWDERRTIADLFAENYFGHFAELCRQNGLLNAIEPYTGPFEAMLSGAPADVVMGEFWSGSSGHPSIKLAASIAHVYGKTVVAAESFTAAPNAGRWLNDPYSMKTLGDLVFAQGLNRYIFHRYAMQPWTNRWPGMTMGQWGFHFERTETWWNQGKPWIDYISRCEFLLQQGRSVNDAAYFIGESAPVDLRTGNPPLPAGYDYDAVNADVLLHHATVKNGRVTLASGANYAVLILPPNDSDLTPKMLKKISELVHDGATVVGARPQHSPSLENFPDCDVQVKKIADKLWGKCDGKTVTENSYGKGRVVWGKPLAEIFAAQKLSPDFEFTGASTASKLVCGHRVAGATEIYFVSNQRDRFDSVDCAFRVAGKIPELWHADSGEMEPAPIWREENGRTIVPLTFDPAGSVFVVFRQPAGKTDHAVALKEVSPPVNLPPPAQLEILHASYGAADDAGSANVTALITKLVDNGALNISANNDTLGGDPAANHVKHLRVDYSLDGEHKTTTVAENDELKIGKSVAQGEPSAFGLRADADGKVFVSATSPGQVELTTASGKKRRAEIQNVPAPQEISGAWDLSFPPNWGAPEKVTFDKLRSWTDSEDSGVKYFSGTATYAKEIEISVDALGMGRSLWLDLGRVKNFAEVSVNGKSLGILWKPPFRVDVTSAVQSGKNKLEIKVTNLWPNRLIGDEQLASDREWNGKQLKEWPQWLLDGKPSPTERFTFTTWHHWTKDDALLESGLIGPVRIISGVEVLAK